MELEYVKVELHKLSMPKVKFNPKNLVLHDFARYFFLFAIVVILGLFFWVISPFFSVLVYAALIAVFFQPLNRWFLKLVRKHEGVAAFLSTLVVLFVVLTPLTFFAIFVVQEAVDAYEVLDDKLLEVDFEGFKLNGQFADLPIIGPLWQNISERYELGDTFKNVEFDVLSIVQDLGEKVTTFLVSQSASILRSVGGTVVGVLIFLLTLFFFLKDGGRLATYFKNISPLPTKYENVIAKKLRETISAIVFGGFGTSILQGLVGGVGFAIAGVENTVFWGTIMAFASLIPYIGASLIWFPMAVAFFLQENWIWGGFILAWGLTAVSFVDNVARPVLIGTRAKMHPLATFLAVLGGLYIFGIKGIIFGPIILSLTITIIHIYQLEYKEVLR